jgi:CheY-like chemotaxis protein
VEVQPILVVEDEALIRLNLVDVLEAGGFTVHEGIDGDMAVAEIDSYDVLHGLVTDVRLGSEVDGWGVARHARLKFPSIAVVYITADSADAWSSEGVPNSIVLQKPFADAQLMDAVTTSLREAGTQPLS